MKTTRRLTVLNIHKRKCKTEQHKPRKKGGLIAGALEELQDPASNVL